MAILHELVETADVVQHNMRYDAAVRLGVDYECLRAIKPDLIYCHTRGFEQGERDGAARQRPDRRRAGRHRLARRRPRRRRHPALAGGRRSATPATASCRPSRSCRRSTTATAPARASSSTRRSCTRSCSTRRSPGACADGSRHGDRPSLDAMQLGWNALLPPLRDRRRLALRRRGRPTSTAAALGVGPRRREHRSPTAPRSTRSEPAFRTPSARPVVRRPRRAPACRARSRRPTSCSTCSTTRR